MSTAEERIKVLEMVRDGILTAAEAAQLLETMGMGEAQEKRPASSNRLSGKGKTFRVRVTDTDSNKARVNVTLPLQLIHFAMKTGAKFTPELDGIDMEELYEAIQGGETGKLVDIVDENDGEHVEVFIE
jgi:hypothetical protein